MGILLRLSTFVCLASALLAAACDEPAPPGTTYYDRAIQPIFDASCVGGVSGCHRDDGTGNALGNLDLSSFEALQPRRDVLRRHGAYPEPLLLIKAVEGASFQVAYGDTFYPLQVVHGGGPVLDIGSPAYLELKRWLDNGATEHGVAPPQGASAGEGPCSPAVLPDLDTDSVDSSAPGYASFAAVQDFLVGSCGAGSCHGTPRADFYLTCGDTDEQTRANFLIARAFVATVPDDSELLAKTLSPSAGGQAHAGGAFFDERTDPDYELVRDWAAEAGPLPVADRTPARQFFDERVMPVLLARGCAFEACHSPIVPFKLNLRAGSHGFFSPIALERNYAQARKLLGLGSPDPLASRIIAKNALAAHGGIRHRAGPIVATGDPRACPQPYDPTTASPVCTLARWRELERAELPAPYRAELSAGTTVPLVYVDRPPDAARFVDFADYRPGADLVRADATLGPAGAIASVTGGASLLDACPGVDASRDAVDVRGPEPSFDGARVVFAMRLSAGGGLDLYEAAVDGSACRRITTDGGEQAGGVTVHNFDPLYVVDDDGEEWIVYASSRAGARTPKLLLPGADLWRERAGGGDREQMTFLRGVERQPEQMHSGELIMSTEKMSPDFYQISGRRLNWDLSDYHPLLAQRAVGVQGRGGYLPGTAPADEAVASIGFAQGTDIREAHDGNFLVVLADAGARGEGGALGVFNRSIGPFEHGRDDPAFVRSLTLVPGASGRAGDASGAYRSPYPAPDGSILASYAPGADVGDGAAKRYELVAVNPRTGQRTTLRAGAQSIVDAVLVVPRPPPHPFVREPSTDADASAEHAVAHYTDLPVLATLLDANDRRGRDIVELRAAAEVRFFTHRPPPAECTSPDHPACADRLAGPEAVYDDRVELGSAPLAGDGSAFVRLPTRQPVFIELVDSDGTVLFRMREETQYGPYENINLGVPERSYHTLCGVCHGSVTGRELDLAVEVDAVTTASQTEARAAGVRDLAP